MNGLDVEHLLDQFEEAWQRNTPPAVEDFLPPSVVSGSALDDPGCRELLKELITTDIEYRWRATPAPVAGQRAPDLPRLEDYFRRYPALLRAETLLTALIGEEYRGRHRWGDHPGHAEYARRFSSRWGQLKDQLTRIDAELAAERIREARGPNVQPPRTTPVHPAQGTAMVPSDAKNFLDTLQQCQLLDPAQRNNPILAEMQKRFPEPRALARELLQRGWLTPYQVNQVFLGRGRELRLSQYLILERLGDGGMGQVFKARHQDMKRTVAIKVIRKDLLGDQESLSRFRREVQMLSQLTHPHVVHAYDAGLTDPTYYLVMEYIEGVSLARLVKERGPLGVEQACNYIRQAALGLQHIHERGLVHRDIKPANLIVTGELGVPATRAAEDDGSEPFPWGVVKIMDLGLGRLQHLAERGAAGSETTAGQVVMGTLDYMAPEQALDFHQADIRADIYSLGCTFHFLLTGQPPFPEGTTAQKLLMHQMKAPPSLEQLRGDLPPIIPPLVRQMMAKRPEDRCQTPAEVARALASLVATASPQARALVPVRANPANQPPATVAYPLMPAGRPMVVVDMVPSKAGRAVERLRGWLQRRPRSQRRRIVLAAGIGAFIILSVCTWFTGNFFWGKPGEPEEVFLFDLKPVEISGGIFGNQGFVPTYPGSHDRTYAVVSGRRSAKGLIVVPPANGYGQVTYRLGKRYRLLNTAVALNDKCELRNSTSFRFSIVGDGRILWESQPIRGRSDAQNCEISVADVDLLQLGISSQNPGTGVPSGPVVWVDPKLTR